MSAHKLWLQLVASCTVRLVCAGAALPTVWIVVLLHARQAGCGCWNMVLPVAP
jgi:hypothetical protein